MCPCSQDAAKLAVSDVCAIKDQCYCYVRYHGAVLLLHTAAAYQRIQTSTAKDEAVAGVQDRFDPPAATYKHGISKGKVHEDSQDQLSWCQA